MTKATNQETDPEKHWPSESTLIKPGHQSVLVTSRKEVACLPSRAGTDQASVHNRREGGKPGIGSLGPLPHSTLPGEHLCIIKQVGGD